MDFKASLDRTAKIATAFIIMLLGFFICLGLWEFYDEGVIGLLFIPIFLLAIIGIVYFYRPLYYSVDSDNLIIHRQAGKITIKKSQIQSAGIIEEGSMGFVIRTFGVGGLFGYFGEFYSRPMGAMTWYVTRQDKFVLIITSLRKIVVSPDDSERFIDALTITLDQGKL